MRASGARLVCTCVKDVAAGVRGSGGAALAGHGCWPLLSRVARGNAAGRLSSRPSTCRRMRARSHGARSLACVLHVLRQRFRRVTCREARSRRGSEPSHAHAPCSVCCVLAVVSASARARRLRQPISTSSSLAFRRARLARAHARRSRARCSEVWARDSGKPAQAPDGPSLATQGTRDSFAAHVG